MNPQRPPELNFPFYGCSVDILDLAGVRRHTLHFLRLNLLEACKWTFHGHFALSRLVLSLSFRY
jgi:hypothetical protein